MITSNTIGNYRIERLLGSGGMADVYLATHTLLKRQFAIKVLKPELCVRDPLMAKRFIREAQIAQKVDHPNIVKVFDVGSDPETGLLFIVMEYIQGVNLAKFSRENRITSPELRTIAYEMSKALVELHRHGIVHRDIKPSNIMLCQDGSLKLMDLGIAKATQTGEEGQETLTMEQAVLGTPAYSSPEQCRNAKTVDIRSDIYCLGASLYAIASGASPYGGTTAMEILVKVLENTPRPLSEIRPDLDIDLVRLIETMMEKSPERRPQTPEELLTMVVSGKSSARKRKQLAAASIAVALLVVLLLAVLLKTMGGKGHNSPGKMSSPVIAETIPPQNPKQTAPVETAAANKQKPLVATATAAEKPLAENRAGTQPVQDQPQPPAKAVAEPQPAPAKPQQPLAAPVTPPANQTLANKPPARPQAAPVSFPPPGNIHITLEERLADVQEKIALLEKDNSARTQKNHKDQVNRVLDLASNTAYLSKRFNDFRMTVYQAQLIRIQAQIKRMNYAMDLDESQFSAQATKEFAESFAQYTKEHRDWGYNRRDMDYTAKMLDSLKSKTINPNVEVVDSTYPQYSGPLLFTLTSDRIQRHRELVLELLKLGANANKVVNTKKVDFPRHPEDQLILTEGGIDRLDNYLIPLLQNVNTYHKEERLAIIRDLILLNHDLLEVDHKGDTALHIATRLGLFDIAMLMIASGADVNAQNHLGETPLFEAEKNHFSNLLTILPILGADADVQNADGKKAADFRETGLFLQAARKGNVQELRKYLGREGFSPDSIIPSNGHTLLEQAIEMHNLKMAELLLEHDANVELHHFNRNTLLAVAMSRYVPENLPIFSLLLDHGANPNVNPVGYGGTYHLLDYIINQYHGSPGSPQYNSTLSFFKRLLQQGTAKNVSGNSYPNLFKRGNADFLSEYLKSPIEFDDRIPIIAIALSADAPDKTIQLLIQKKANVNAVVNAPLNYTLDNAYLQQHHPKSTNDSRTALYIAVEMKRLDTVRLLIKNGAQVDWTSASGTSIRQLNTSPEIKKLLK